MARVYAVVRRLVELDLLLALPVPVPVMRMRPVSTSSTLRATWALAV